MSATCRDLRRKYTPACLTGVKAQQNTHADRVSNAPPQFVAVEENRRPVDLVLVGHVCLVVCTTRTCSAVRPMSVVPRRRRANSGACQNSFRRIDPWAAPLPTPSLHVCDLCVRRGQLDEMALIAKRMRKVGFPIRHE